MGIEGSVDRWTPHRPAPVRVINAVGPRLVRPDRVFSLNEDSIVAAAEARTGLSAGEQDVFRPGLRRLVAALDDEADLHFLGRMWARGGCVNLVSNALRIADDLKRHPEILAGGVERPVVIVGMSRTGSTLLQHLLGADPANRTLRHWEAAQPSPPPEKATYETDPRIARSERAFKVVYYMVPHGRALHPMEADRPTECVSLLAHSFMSMEFPASNHVPGYLSWLLDQDMTAAYQHYRQQLQLLQWRCRADRWVVKAPAHLFHLGALLDVFPDARIVQLHRDPVRVIGSFCSLTAHFYGVGSDEVDRRSIGATWPAVWAEGLDRMVAVRDARGSSAFLDVHYADLLADPLAVVRRIYAQLDLEFTPDAEAAMRAHLASNSQDAHGVHRYDLRDFGIDPGTERDRFERYRERFAIPEEPMPS